MQEFGCLGIAKSYELEIVGTKIRKSRETEILEFQDLEF